MSPWCSRVSEAPLSFRAKAGLALRIWFLYPRVLAGLRREQLPAYVARFQNQTPWSRRCLGKAVVFKRWACEQLGSKDPHPAAKAVVLSIGGRALSLPDTLQIRKFSASSGEKVILYELAEVSSSGAYRLYQS